MKKTTPSLIDDNTPHKIQNFYFILTNFITISLSLTHSTQDSEFLFYFHQPYHHED